MAGFVEVSVDHACAVFDAGSFDDVEDGGAVDTEVLGYPIDRGAGGVAGENFARFVIVQAMLDLSRSGSSSGWAITSVTSNDLTKFGYGVVVGVPAQELHSRQSDVP